MKQVIPTAKTKIDAMIAIPGSKSITNRALVLAALAVGTSRLTGLLLSDDTLACIQGLRALGIDIQLDSDAKSAVVIGCSGQFPVLNATIQCQRAGTVARFLMAAAAGTPGEYTFDADAQLRVRPMHALLHVLWQQGARLLSSQNEMPLTFLGANQLHGGQIEINDAASSQFVSALLMISPYAKHDVKILTTNNVRPAYIDMTLAMMLKFGVTVTSVQPQEYVIAVPRSYQACSYEIEPDLSSASYFFAAAALTQGKVRIAPFAKQSLQPDAAFLSILAAMGCHVVNTPSELSVEGPDVLMGVEVDMRDCSDTFMTLAAIAPFAKTPTNIKNIAHTRLQESDRITAMCAGLRALGVRVEEAQDGLVIYPSTPKSATIDTHQDHRIAMAFAVLGLRVPGVALLGAECVAKTFPDFFAVWQREFSSI